MSMGWFKYFPKGACGEYQEPEWFSFIVQTKYGSDTHIFLSRHRLLEFLMEHSPADEATSDWLFGLNIDL